MADLEDRIKNRSISDILGERLKQRPSFVCSSEYYNLDQNSKSMKKLVKEIERNIKKNTSVWSRLCFSTKNFFVRYVQRKIVYHYDSLLSQQLHLMNKTAQSLANLSSASRELLSDLENYHQEVSQEFNTNLTQRKEVKESLDSKMSELEKQEKVLESKPKDSEDYFTKENYIVGLKRECMELTHSYELTNDAVSTLRKEKERLLYQETLLRVYTHLLERMTQYTNRVVRHLDKTIALYPVLEKNSQALESAETTIALLTPYVNEIDRSVLMGLRLRADAPDPGHYLSVSDIKDAIGRVEQVKNNRTAQVEKTVEAYLH